MKLKYLILCFGLAACGTSQYYPDEINEASSDTPSTSRPTTGATPADVGVPEPDNFVWYYINASSVAKGYVTVWFDVTYDNGYSLESVFVSLNGIGKVVKAYKKNEFEVKFEVSPFEENFKLVVGNPASHGQGHAEKWKLNKLLTLNSSNDDSDENAEPDKVIFHMAQPHTIAGMYVLQFEVEHNYANEDADYVWVRVSDDQQILAKNDDGLFEGWFEARMENGRIEIEIGNGPFNRAGDLVTVGNDWTQNFYISEEEESEEIDFPKQDFMTILEGTDLSSFSWYLLFEYTCEYNYASDCEEIQQSEKVDDYLYNISHCDDLGIYLYTFTAITEARKREFQNYFNNLSEELSPYYTGLFEDPNYNQTYKLYEFTYGDIPYRVYMADDISSYGLEFEIQFEWDVD